MFDRVRYRFDYRPHQQMYFPPSGTLKYPTDSGNSVARFALVHRPDF
jgi:hypothetical protein